MEMYRSTCVKMLDFQVPASFQLFSIDCQRKPMTLKFCFSTSSVWIWTSRQNMKSFFALSQTQHQQDSESYLVGHVHLDLDEIVARRLRRPWKSTKNTFVTRALNKKHIKQKLYTLWSMRWEKWRNDTKRWNFWIIWCIDCISPITCCVVSGPPDHGQDCILARVRVVHTCSYILHAEHWRARYKHWRAKSKFYCAGRCITGGEAKELLLVDFGTSDNVGLTW